MQYPSSLNNVNSNNSYLQPAVGTSDEPIDESPVSNVARGILATSALEVNHQGFRNRADGDWPHGEVTLGQAGEGAAETPGDALALVALSDCRKRSMSEREWGDQSEGKISEGDRRAAKRPKTAGTYGGEVDSWDSSGGGWFVDETPGAGDIMAMEGINRTVSVERADSDSESVLRFDDLDDREIDYYVNTGDAQGPIEEVDTLRQEALNRFCGRLEAMISLLINIDGGFSRESIEDFKQLLTVSVDYFEGITDKEVLALTDCWLEHLCVRTLIKENERCPDYQRRLASCPEGLSGTTVKFEQFRPEDQFEVIMFILEVANSEGVSSLIANRLNKFALYRLPFYLLKNLEGGTDANMSPFSEADRIPLSREELSDMFRLLRTQYYFDLRDPNIFEKIFAKWLTNKNFDSLSRVTSRMWQLKRVLQPVLKRGLISSHKRWGGGISAELVHAAIKQMAFGVPDLQSAELLGEISEEFTTIMSQSLEEMSAQQERLFSSLVSLYRIFSLYYTSDWNAEHLQDAGFNADMTIEESCLEPLMIADRRLCWTRTPELGEFDRGRMWELFLEFIIRNDDARLIRHLIDLPLVRELGQEFSQEFVVRVSIEALKIIQGANGAMSAHDRRYLRIKAISNLEKIRDREELKLTKELEDTITRWPSRWPSWYIYAIRRLYQHWADTGQLSYTEERKEMVIRLLQSYMDRSDDRKEQVSVWVDMLESWEQEGLWEYPAEYQRWARCVEKIERIQAHTRLKLAASLWAVERRVNAGTWGYERERESSLYNLLKKANVEEVRLLILRILKEWSAKPRTTDQATRRLYDMLLEGPLDPEAEAELRSIFPLYNR